MSLKNKQNRANRKKGERESPRISKRKKQEIKISISRT